jgi:spore maturation protein CgeB
VDSEGLLPWPRSLGERVAAKLYGRPPARRVADLNAAICRAIDRGRPGLTFLVQGRFVEAATAEAARRHGRVVLYCNDDMYNPRNRTYTLSELTRAVDCVLTTKSPNVPEFTRDGAQRVVYQPNAFDPKVHFPAKVADGERSRFAGDVAFVGTFRPERADWLARVVRSCRGLVVNVWGGGWHKMRRPTHWHRRARWAALQRRVCGAELWGEDMGKAFQANKIGLGLLYHANRDLHTSRSFEIPACGGFMLAERTDEHREYFEEDREAVYFGTFEEQIDKIVFYAAHDDSRRQIAAAGLRRCQTSGYRYVDRARDLLRRLT